MISDEYEFDEYHDVTSAFDESDEAWSLYLTHNGEEFEVLYFPYETDGFIVMADGQLPREQYERHCFAAFCFLSVILISTDDK